MTSQPAYPPPHYREDRVDTILDLIRAVGFGQLVSVGEGRPYATNVPFLVRADGEQVVLEAHLQRGNPQWRAITGEALALFQGPHAYVRPGWYETKKQHGKVVPTWNYVSVHFTGRLTVHQDSEWVREVVGLLTARHEAGRPAPWHVSDAPPDFIDGQLRAIVGVELAISTVEAKEKLSQNRDAGDRAGALDGLRHEPGAGPAAIAELMARQC